MVMIFLFFCFILVQPAKVSIFTGNPSFTDKDFYPSQTEEDWQSKGLADENQVYKDCRQGKKDRIHSVQHSAMSRHDVAGILDFNASFKHGFYQVAETAENNH